jgi:replicative DNA helicase
MRSAPATQPDRLPPQDQQAESIVLGECLRNSEAGLLLTLLTMRAGDFYGQAHRDVFAALQEVFNLNRPVSPETVAGRLRERGELETSGGIEYLRHLHDDWHVSRHVDDARRTVRDKATLREMLSWTEQVRDRIYTHEHDASGVIAEVAADALRFAEHGGGPTTVTPAVTETQDWAAIQEALAQDFDVTPARFGVGALDRYTGGLGNMVHCLLMAMQGSGKTRFATHAALSSAQQFARIPEEDRPHVLVFPLEEGRLPWVRNAVGWLAGIDSQKLMPGRALSSEREAIAQRAQAGHRRLLDLPVVIAENVDTAAHLTTLIRIEARRRRLGLVVVDYLQRLGRDAEEERQTLARISLDLQSISERLRVPVLLLSQLTFNADSGINPYGGRGPAFDASLALVLERKTGDDGRKLDEGLLSCYKARPIPEFPQVKFHVNYAIGGHYFDENEWSEAQAREHIPGRRMEVRNDGRY